MAYPVRVCALIGRFTDARVAESAHALVPYLQSRQVEVLMSEDAPIGEEPTRVARVPEREIGERADLIIAIGGDGTLLYAARLVARHGVPLLGINRGRLGFLTDVMPNDMFPSIDAALQGNLQKDERPLLAARLHSSSGAMVESLALNDVVLQKLATGRMVDFSTLVNGNYVNKHAGDGIVVASATGSTAYALSCGGPIVEPSLDVFVVAPICPHTLSDRPIVVPADRAIRLVLRGVDRAQAMATFDGPMSETLEAGDVVEVRRATYPMRLIHPAGYSYFGILRNKLRWGSGPETRLERA